MAYASWQTGPSLFGSAFRRLSEAPTAQRLTDAVASRQNRRAVALIAWNLQAQLSTVALLSMLALVSVWTALVVMVAWSALAALVYFHGRRSGLPDVFGKHKAAREGRAGHALVSAGQACLGGIQPFVYTRTLCGVLDSPASCLRSRLHRLAVLSVGLTLFGVTAAHHLLQKAGYEGRTLLHYSLLGAVLHASYRILLSGAMISAVVRLSGSFPA